MSNAVNEEETSADDSLDGFDAETVESVRKFEKLVGESAEPELACGTDGIKASEITLLLRESQ